MYAFLLIALFAAFLGAASHFGWSVDSRDSADWKPTNTPTIRH
jgi:hypothetical protein